MRTESYEANHVSLQNITSPTAWLFSGMPCNKKRKIIWKMSKITCCYMRNEIAKPTHISLAALLSIGILHNKEWKSTEKTQWSIHYIEKLFWQIYCLLCPAGWMVKKKKVKMIWLSSQPQLTNHPTQLRTTIDLNYFWLTPCASFKKKLYLNLYL